MKLSRSDDFVRTWAPAIGLRASGIAPWAKRSIAAGGVLVPVWGLLLIWGISADIQAVRIAASVLIVADVLTLLVALVLLHMMFRAMSAYLGVHVSILNSPTFREPDFERWCRRNNVVSGSSTRHT